MKKLYIIFLFFCLYLPASAQRVSFTPQADTLPMPRFVIKWAPISIIDIDPTVQLGLEYLPGGKWTVQQELGFGRFQHSGVFSPNGRDIQGKEVWRSRTEARYYLSNYRPRPIGSYIAFEMLYKKVNYKGDERIGRNCENGDCEYRETVEYKILKDVVGFHFKFGVQAPIGKRVALDFYIGIGGRNANVRTNNKELEAIWKEEHQIMLGNPSRPGSYGLISGNLGFKVGYLLYK
jgi:hypothetical protein